MNEKAVRKGQGQEAGQEASPGPSPSPLSSPDSKVRSMLFARASNSRVQKFERRKVVGYEPAECCGTCTWYAYERCGKNDFAVKRIAVCREWSKERTSGGQA